MKRSSLYFSAPEHVEIRQEDLPPLARDEVLVQTLISGISAGTEMLIYRDELPPELSKDESLPALNGRLELPMKYGYASIGRVVDLGPDVGSEWADSTVFAFNPHESHFTASPTDLILLPEDLSPEDALFIPNMESAVNFLHDGRPIVGECVVVYGQGIVGLLTSALLQRIPLGSLITLDRYLQRREASLQIGAHTSLDPGQTDVLSQIEEVCRDNCSSPGADLSYELTGSPEALNLAIAATAYNGRVVIGSWYGRKKASLDLGGHFHRNRIRLINSQVSSIDPALRGRWTKGRRLQTAVEFVRTLKPSRWITHRIPFNQAKEAYSTLDEAPENALQVILEYP